MTDFARALDAVRGKVQTDWSPDRARRVGRSLLRRRKRQVATRAALGVLAVCLVAISAVSAWQRRPSLVAPTLAQNTLAVRLAPGIQAERLDAMSELKLKSAAPELAVAELVRGGARFHVTHEPARVFRVEVGAVVIEDVGTQFTVERREDTVRVTVDEGQVRVRWPGGTRVLSAGEHEGFSPNAAEPDAAFGALTPAPLAPHRHHRRTTSAASWKALAEDGDYDAAYDVLQKDGASSVRDETADLLLAVDVARLSHHPSEAVSPLHRILAHHQADPRAPLAAFTLGRVLLEDLGSPREAAGAFVQAQRLEPKGPLAEDALAREVESWSRAGELQRAHARAEEYLQRYPDGRRARSVSRFGHAE